MTPHSTEADASGEQTRPEGCQDRVVHMEHVEAVRQNLLAPERASQIASMFAILGDPTRLQVVYALLNTPGGELCVCDLATGLGRDDTTISHQLRVLRNQRIVTMRKVGRVVYYRLIDTHVRQLLELGLHHAREMTLSSVRSETEVLI